MRIMAFKRVRRVPIMERTDNEVLFRVVHSALKVDDGVSGFYSLQG